MMLWTAHASIVERSIHPGSDEDRRFLALALCGEAGELANLVKKEWRGDGDPERRAKIEDECGDILAYLLLFCKAHDIDLELVMRTVTLPKIARRWPNSARA